MGENQLDIMLNGRKVISQHGKPLETYLNHRGARYMSQIRGSNRPLLILTDSHICTQKFALLGSVQISSYYSHRELEFAN